MALAIIMSVMRRDLDISLLRTFVTVADRASMTAAGNALNLTQGAVSQQIRRLEEVFGGALFLRVRRGLRLTAPGERLLGKARRLLGLNDEIWTEMIAARAGAKLRLGAPYDLVGTCVAPLLKSFTEARPQVEISLVCLPSPDLVEGLTKG
jgi:DNA-binding transcriptional LysR family regulator